MEPAMKELHNWHKPLESRKYVSAHWEQLMKLLDAEQEVQPADPWYVVSVHKTHKLETRMPWEQAVQVEPSVHEEQ